MKPQAPPSSMLSCRTFAIARVACVALALLALGLFAAGLPALYDELSAGFDGDEVRANLAQIGLSTGFYAWYVVVFAIVLTVTHYAIAMVIFLRRSGELFPLLVALTLALLGADATRSINVLVAHNPILQPLLDFFNALTGATALLFIYLFPDGRFVPRWTRWPAVLAIAWSVSTDLFHDLQFSSEHWLYWLTLLGGPLIGVFAQVYRYRRVSSPVERQQTKWVVFGLVVMIVGYAVVVAAYPVFSIGRGTLIDLVLSTIHAGLLLLIPLSFGIAILRYRLWDIDIIINRTLVYAVLTASVVGLYIAVVGGLGALLEAPQGNLIVSLLAAGLVAVLFAPLRVRLQRGVNHLMYGERDEPYAVISRLGQRLEATIAPAAVLETIVETVAGALKLPHAAIALKRGDSFESAAARGIPRGEPAVLPLVYQRETIGQLILSPRAPGETFTLADRRLLEDFARQAAVAVHAVRLTGDLQRSHERLVLAREEERRLQELALLKTDFTAMVAHELGAPLGALRRLVEMLSTAGADPEVRDYALGAMEREIAALETLIADVRRAGEVERDDFRVAPRSVPLVGLLTEAKIYAETLPGDHPIELVFEGGLDKTEQVLADPKRVGQVLRNLLSNAAKYSPEGTPIELRAKGGPGHIRVEVADHGAGIHPDDLTRIFEKFGRGRDQEGRRIAGVGLGLYLSRRIVRSHGSDFAVSSAPGEGSVFGFELEVAR